MFPDINIRNFTICRACLHLACCTIIIACHEQQAEADYVTISPQDVSFTYQADMQQSITITTNAEWRLTFVPEWLSASAKSGTGTSTITLTTRQRNNATAEYRSMLYVEAGTTRDSIIVVQNPRVAQCYARPALPLALCYGLACKFESGSRTNFYCFHVYTDAEYAGAKTQLDCDLEAMTRNWEQHSTAENFLLVYDKCEPGNSYHLVTVGYDTNNIPGGYEDYVFSTPEQDYAGPSVKLTLMPDVQSITERGTVWQWHVEPQGNCREYITYACASPKLFDNYSAATAIDDSKRRGLRLAWLIFEKRMGNKVKATCNVGAKRPDEMGSRFAWGETEEKEVYNDKTYIFMNVDLGSNISETEYDVAYKRWRGEGQDTFFSFSSDIRKWRMPTIEEIEELAAKCTMVWTHINGQSGQYITGPNGNSIFIPMGTYWSATANNYGLYGAGAISFYETIIALGGSGSNSSTYSINSYGRSDGCYIRPVCEL